MKNILNLYTTFTVKKVGMNLMKPEPN